MTSATKAHILVVEDEADFVAYLREVLETAGYRVSAAFDGAEALEIVYRDPPDLVTLDISMPRKTGVLFYRQMKAEVRLRDIPVVVITGLRTGNRYAAPFIERFFEFDNPPLPRVDAYLDKPVSKADLLATVARFVAPPVRSW